MKTMHGFLITILYMILFLLKYYLVQDIYDREVPI